MKILQPLKPIRIFPGNIYLFQSFSNISSVNYFSKTLFTSHKRVTNIYMIKWWITASSKLPVLYIFWQQSLVVLLKQPLAYSNNVASLHRSRPFWKPSAFIPESIKENYIDKKKRKGGVFSVKVLAFIQCFYYFCALFNLVAYGYIKRWVRCILISNFD